MAPCRDAFALIFLIEFSWHRSFLTFIQIAASFSGLLTCQLVTGMRLCSAGWGRNWKVGVGGSGFGAGGPEQVAAERETGKFVMVLEQLY